MQMRYNFTATKMAIKIFLQKENPQALLKMWRNGNAYTLLVRM
jgi:hypothetical protein